MKNDVDVELGEFQLLVIFYSTELLTALLANIAVVSFHQPNSIVALMMPNCN